MASKRKLATVRDSGAALCPQNNGSVRFALSPDDVSVWSTT